MSWEAYRLKMGEKGFSLVGFGQRFRGEVYQGAMKQDVYWGLKAMELHSCRPRLLHSWSIETPYFFNGQKNRGDDRHYLRFVSPNAAPFVLKFQETVTAELLRDLREAFAATHIRREVQSDEEPAGEAVEHPAGAAEGHRKGRPVGGEDRDAAGHGDDPGAGRLEKRKQGKVGRPAKKRRT